MYIRLKRVENTFIVRTLKPGDFISRVNRLIEGKREREERKGEREMGRSLFLSVPSRSRQRGKGRREREERGNEKKKSGSKVGWEREREKEGDIGEGVESKRDGYLHL